MLKTMTEYELRFSPQNPALRAKAQSGAFRLIAKNAAPPQTPAALRLIGRISPIANPTHSPKTAPSAKLGVSVPPYPPQRKIIRMQNALQSKIASKYGLKDAELKANCAAERPLPKISGTYAPIAAVSKNANGSVSAILKLFMRSFSHKRTPSWKYFAANPVTSPISAAASKFCGVGAKFETV